MVQRMGPNNIHSQISSPRLRPQPQVKALQIHEPPQLKCTANFCLDCSLTSLEELFSPTVCLDDLTVKRRSKACVSSRPTVVGFASCLVNRHRVPKLTSLRRPKSVTPPMRPHHSMMTHDFGPHVLNPRTPHAALKAAQDCIHMVKRSILGFGIHREPWALSRKRTFPSVYTEHKQTPHIRGNGARYAPSVPAHRVIDHHIAFILAFQTQAHPANILRLFPLNTEKEEWFPE